VLVLAAAVVVMARVRRSLRPPAASGGVRRGPLRVERGSVLPRVLEARGLATAAEIGSMSAREQEFLLEHGGGMLGRGGALRVAAQRRTPPAHAAVAHTAAVRTTAPLHCPACGAAFGHRGDAPYLVAPCPRCGRRVSAHREGGRLVVTVEAEERGR
jgi:hypothetical protein